MQKERHNRPVEPAGQRLPDDKSKASRSDVEAFLDTIQRSPSAVAASGEPGRLLFALDATASRQPTWDRAAHIQAEMFQATSDIGGLAIQLCFYRGFGEFKVSPWLSDANRLVRMMTSVTCLAGRTQIAKVLSHAANETRRKRIGALVFVGDSMEEDVDTLGNLAGHLGVLGVPAYIFHEGDNPIARFAFNQIATLTGGAACRFDGSSAKTLRDLLCAVAVFAAGGRPELERYAVAEGGDVRRLADLTRPGG